MTSKKRPNPSQQELDQRAKDIQQMKNVQANQQAVENETQLLNRMLSLFMPVLAEFEIDEKKIEEMKKTQNVNGNMIADEKEKWNAESVERATIDKMILFG
mmetsp:Transcript_4652/g.9797  ORF Transcript_4652/g.9797 Transcript_4652/m.9797 type:complete len:101 (-) Transcript_4652:451-753(-)